MFTILTSELLTYFNKMWLNVRESLGIQLSQNKRKQNTT